ncbi:MAG: hypothetical protein PWQ59_1895 [Thermoanaerobacterium sp.]|nr:hypothetical protein [Thermoanaerobacterium sp. CMT5567-10]MDI3478370.1 hypothetical protein [Thermoanaerobacterium sp.]MDK2805803.1 hypothetical protein [Thermoanaerobacterium sp.]MDN5317908.1 hypothetical protein [Thermoanaerobacterium sp.]WKV07491.1 hypothetical protein Q2T46_07820 [Thermoanaerobacterium sp. CMT5567-10]
MAYVWFFMALVILIQLIRGVIKRKIDMIGADLITILFVVAIGILHFFNLSKNKLNSLEIHIFIAYIILIVLFFIYWIHRYNKKNGIKLVFKKLNNNKK